MTVQPKDFFLGDAILQWLAICGALSAIAILVALVTLFSTYGKDGIGRWVEFMGKVYSDFITVAPRRIFAIASLTFKEAIRRKALMVFVVFAVLFMFASWFTTDTNMRPGMQVKIHVMFVTKAISWIVLLVVLLLSCWALPEDIRLRSLHTVVTKPVRRCEVVMGRILGFAGIGSLILGIMGVVGYIWIERQISSDVDLICRVPVYGDLSFIDRRGNAQKHGINVGDIVQTRGFIEGASKATAVWKFDVTDETDVILLESRFEAFRTWKGDMNRSLRIQFTMVKEVIDEEGKVDLTKSEMVRLEPFLIKEFTHNIFQLKRKDTYTLDDGESVERDVFKDMLVDGKLTIHVQCLDRQQFLGVSKGDFFIRIADRPFVSGYTKIIVGRWLLMLLVIIIGVTASCIVKGPVAIMLVGSLFLIGHIFRDMMEKILDGTSRGGGAIESVYRMLTHMNDTTVMAEGVFRDTVKAIDGALVNGLWLIHHIVPDLTTFDTAIYVAHGFDVPFNGAVLPSICISFGYLFPCVMFGYLCLSLRELEAK
jgi:hypothetical protein